MQVLRLLETFDLDVLHGAVKDALRLGAIGYDAVKHLVLCRIEGRPPKLDMELYLLATSTNGTPCYPRDLVFIEGLVSSLRVLL